MQLAKVCGTVVSTSKDPSLEGVKLLFVQFMDESGELLQGYEVAADTTVGAGVEEWVLVSRGSAARQLPRRGECPIDAAVVAIVDTVNLGGRQLYSKKDELV